jgi:hypothetical protein
MDRMPWQDWLTETSYRRLFPRGDADLQAFYDRVEDRERRYGIPAVCKDPAVYDRVARIAAGLPVT